MDCRQINKNKKQIISMIQKLFRLLVLVCFVSFAGNKLLCAEADSLPPLKDSRCVGTQSGWPNANNAAKTAHGGRVNYAFVDGRIESIKWNATCVIGTGTTKNSTAYGQSCKAA